MSDHKFKIGQAVSYLGLPEPIRLYSFYPSKVMISNIGLETPTSLTRVAKESDLEQISSA